MKKVVNLKLFAIFSLILVLGTAIFCSFSLRQASISANIDKSNANYGYYYNQLSSSAKKFYVALDEMSKSSAFTSGNGDYDLVASGTVTQTQLASYTSGNAELLKAFGIAKDAFNLDHPEIFYVDFDKLSLSIWTKADGTYLAKIDAGRTGSYYIENGFSSATEIAEAQTKIDDEVALFIEEVQGVENKIEKIKIANKEIATKVNYGFGDDTTKTSAHIRSIYGGLVNKLVVCEGYARTFKLFMDKINIPCTIIYGYLLDEENNTYEPHAWNEVRLENGEWYAVDPTLNASNVNNEKYFLIGSDELDADHIADGTVSNCGQKIKYPTLATKNYGVQDIVKTVAVDRANNCIDVAISYNSKNAVQLKDEDNLYLVTQFYEYSSTGIISTAYATALFKHPTNGNKTNLTIYSQWQMAKLYVTSEAPNADEIYYTSKLNADKIIAESDYIENELFGTSKLPPVARFYTPSNNAPLSALETLKIKVEYDEALKKIDENATIQINVTTARDGDMSKYVKVEDVTFDGNKTIEFTFTPSLMYQHNYTAYNFIPTNLVSTKTEVAPKAFTYYFQRKSIICNKVLSGDRLYMEVYGQPTLIDNSDLSMKDWQIDGNNVMQGQRSQMALVVSEPNKQAQDDMKSDVLDKGNIEEKDILSYATYELELDICGVLAKIPAGSYVKLSFGFPKGYSAKDTGVTFKVYHFKYDENGKIDTSKTEEIDCVITEYGLVVTVDNFSPFMVVAFNGDKVAQNSKTIYSRIATNGGQITARNAENQVQTNVASIKENGSITYTITPNENYALDYVLLNKKKIAVNEDNTITLTFAQLEASNTIEFAFVNDSVKENETTNNLTNANLSFQTNYTVSSNENNDDEVATKVDPLITLLISFVVALIAVSLIYMFYKKYNKKA